MALYDNDEKFICPKCSNNIFIDINPYYISKNKSSNIYTKKQISNIDKYVQCISCGHIIKSPL